MVSIVKGKAIKIRGQRVRPYECRPITRRTREAIRRLLVKP